jgi:hypothetical protein
VNGRWTSQASETGHPIHENSLRLPLQAVFFCIDPPQLDFGFIVRVRSHPDTPFADAQAWGTRNTEGSHDAAGRRVYAPHCARARLKIHASTVAHPQGRLFSSELTDPNVAESRHDLAGFRIDLKEISAIAFSHPQTPSAHGDLRWDRTRTTVLSEDPLLDSSRGGVEPEDRPSLLVVHHPHSALADGYLDRVSASDFDRLNHLERSGIQT